jgi:hypothetical protein
MIFGIHGTSQNLELTTSEVVTPCSSETAEGGDGTSFRNVRPLSNYTALQAGRSDSSQA